MGETRIEKCRAACDGRKFLLEGKKRALSRRVYQGNAEEDNDGSGEERFIGYEIIKILFSKWGCRVICTRNFPQQSQIFPLEEYFEFLK